MSLATLIPVEQYLKTIYRPDCDYVDGVLWERNFGQKDHSKLQRDVLLWFQTRSRELGIAAFPEQRVQVSVQRFRVPDVCVTKLPEPDEQVFTQPPYICVEIVSPDDSFPRMQERFDDFLRMGVENLWVLDPVLRRAWWITEKGHFEVLDGVLRTLDRQVSLPLAEVFAPK